MFAARRLQHTRPLGAPAGRLLHASARAYVQVGDKIPNVELMENSPGNKVNIADELKSGKGLVIGKPQRTAPKQPINTSIRNIA
jgi:2-Cys peroxiredoxin 5